MGHNDWTRLGLCGIWGKSCGHDNGIVWPLYCIRSLDFLGCRSELSSRSRNKCTARAVMPWLGLRLNAVSHGCVCVCVCVRVCVCVLVSLSLSLSLSLPLYIHINVYIYIYFFFFLNARPRPMIHRSVVRGVVEGEQAPI